MKIILDCLQKDILKAFTGLGHITGVKTGCNNLIVSILQKTGVRVSVYRRGD